jgi:peptide/nickel transport system substrate-binding protein
VAALADSSGPSPAIRTRLRRAAALAACAALTAASGCGQAAAPAQRPRPVVLHVGIAQPPDAPTAHTAVTQAADLLRYAALVTTARDGAVQDGLAERWTSSPDGLQWRFTLRPGLRFDDGSPLDARAIAAMVDELRRDPNPRPGLRDIVEVRTDGPRIVVIEQRAPSSLLLESLAQEWVFGGRDGNATAGPFRLVSQDRGQAVLEAFDGYYRGRPRIDRVELRGYPSPRAAWVALMRGDIDLLYDLPVEAIEFVEASTDIQVFPVLRSLVHLLGFNLAHPALRDARVRRAIGQAIDRHAVVSHAFGGRGVVAQSGVWIRHWAADPSLVQFRYDPARARALLVEALGRRRERPGLDVLDPLLRLPCLVPAGYPAFERSALILQRQLLDVGIDLQPEVVPFRELQERLQSGRFVTYLFEQATGLGLNWAYWFWHSPEDAPPWIASHYDGADAVLDRVRRARTREEFRTAVHDVQRVLAEDPPAVFLAWNEVSRAARRRFAIPREAERDVFASLASWRVAAEEQEP